MKSQISPEKKLADWESVFSSMSNLHNDEALKGLIAGLRAKLGVITLGET
jgi:hypothetical protein